MAAFNIMKGLVENDVEVHLVTSKPYARFKRFFRLLADSGVNIHEVKLSPGHGFLHWLALSITCLRLMLKLGIDIAHPHNPKDGFILGLMAKVLRRRVVFTVEGDPLYEASFISIGFMRRFLLSAFWFISLRAADLVSPCSHWLEGLIKERYKVGVKARSIHNPIDWDRFVKAKGSHVKERLGVKGFMVFTAARLAHVKGLETLIKAVPHILKEKPDVFFILAGDGPLRKDLEKLAEELHVERHVIFLGFRDDVERFMAACDVVVLPSVYEPFGMPIAEAGACRKPIIVSNVGGLPEIVKDGATGFIVPPGDHVRLAEAILKLLKNPEMMERIGEAGYRQVEALFTPKAIGMLFLYEYMNLVKHS